MTGCKSQMLKWPQLLPSPCSAREVSRSTTALWRCSAPGPAWPEHCREGQRGSAEAPASSHSPTVLEEQQQQLCKHTHSTLWFVLKPFTLISGVQRGAPVLLPAWGSRTVLAPEPSLPHLDPHWTQARLDGLGQLGQGSCPCPGFLLELCASFTRAG